MIKSFLMECAALFNGFLYNQSMLTFRYIKSVLAHRQASVGKGCLVLLFIVLTAEAWAQSEAWKFQDIEGATHTLSQYKGRWVIVNYWAPWCPPCLEEMPALVAFYDAHREHNVMVIGVAVQYETVQSVLKYIDDMLVSYPIVLGEAQSKPIYRPEVLPTTYIYQPDGSLYLVKRGSISKHFLEQLLTKAAIKSGK